jgi:hypothetical protein
MNDLREDLDRRAAGFTPDRAAYERVLDRAALRRARRRITAGVTAFAISAAAFTGLWAANHLATVPAHTPTASVPAPTPHDGLEIGLRAHVGGWVTLAADSGVWVAGGGRLFAVDPRTGDATEVAASSWDYDYVHLADAGGDAIWIASGPHLWRFDASSRTISNELDLSSLGFVDAVAQVDGQTWVTASGPAGQQVLARIDAGTGTVLERFPGVGQGVHQLVEAAGFLFVGAREDDGSLLRIDPATGERVTVPAYAPGEPHGGGDERVYSLAAVGRSVWADRGGFSVSCIDAITLASCGEREANVVAIASDDEFLWILSGTGSTNSSIYLPDPSQPATVTLLGGRSGIVLAGPIPLPDVTPASISAANGHAWIGFHDSGRVIRVDTCSDPACGSDRVRERIGPIQERIAALSEVLHTKLASLDELRTALRRSPKRSIQTQILEVQMEINQIEIKQAELQADFAQLLDQIAPDAG